MTPFVILHLERSGSDMLRAMLNGHPQVRCEGELFDVDGQGEGTPGEAAHNAGILARLWASDIRAPGFKLKIPAQLDAYPDVFASLTEPAADVRCIALFRQNLLKHAISKQNQMRLLARGEGPTHLAPVDVGPLHLDIDLALAYIRDTERIIRDYHPLVRRFARWHLVHYEDLITRTADVGAAVLDFLDLPAHRDLVPTTHKVTPDRLQDALANYDAVAAAMTDNGLSRFLSAP